MGLDEPGDGGAATNASLYWPTSVALDAAGNLYICDYLNGCIRKVDTNGIITTVANLPWEALWAWLWMPPATFMLLNKMRA